MMTTVSDLSPHVPTGDEENEFQKRLANATRIEEAIPVRTAPDGRPTAWAPQAGSQNEFMASAVLETLFHGTRGPGKDVQLQTLMLTDRGWITAGEVTYKDRLVALDGTFARILGIYPKKNRPMRKVIFHDGAIVTVDAEHRWLGKNDKVGYREGWKVRTTDQMMKTACGYTIPFMEGPWEGLHKWKGPDPYMVGLLLGDGTMRSARVTLYSADEEIMVHASSLGWNRYHYEGQVMRAGCPVKMEQQWRDIMPRVKAKDKSVPKELMNADPVARLAVLQGLMDSDGHCEKNGKQGFCSNSEQLAKDVVELAKSLGGFGSVRHEDREPTMVGGYRSTGGRWRVNIRHNNKFKPFCLKRKMDRLTVQKKFLTRGIKSIEPCGIADGVCFAVEHPDHLYIIEDWVITHNTDALLMSFAQHVGKGHGAAWTGIIFRQSYPQLADVQAKSEKWFRLIFPQAKFNKSKMMWEWPTGEKLLLRHMARREDYWCVPHGDALTRRGWVPIQDVKIGEEALTCNPVTKKLEWLPVATKTVQDYAGPMKKHEGRGTYMEFTPGHKLVNADGTLQRYKDMPRKVELMHGGWSIDQPGITEFTMPGETAAQDENPATMSGDLYCEFMGWFLSEGHTLLAGQKNVIGIAQSDAKAKNCQAIERMLTAIGVKWSRGHHQYLFGSRRWANYLRQFGKCRDKHVPKEILEQASSEQMQIFLDAYIAGDGRRQMDRAYIYTTSRQMATDLQTIGVLLGISPYVASTQRKERVGLSYTITLNPKKVFRLFTDNRKRRIKKHHSGTQVKEHNYIGKVYCLGFKKNHTFFIRQNDTVWLSGNSYHGHEYPFIGWEELTNWSDDSCFKSMFSCCRSSTPNIPKMIRSTCNPYGAGHGWIKDRYRLHGNTKMTINVVDAVDVEGRPEPFRCAIHGNVRENKILLAADPNYIQNVIASASNPAMAKAWLEGSWDIIAGGMFDDVWNVKYNVITRFMVPDSWRIDRSFDWGSSSPFSVCWWAESDGTDLRYNDGSIHSTVRGDLFLIKEWYGWNGEPNKGLKMLAVDIAKGIVEREMQWGFRTDDPDLPLRVKPGPADSSIYDTENGVCIGTDMAKAVRIDNLMHKGVYWTRADKRPGSRKTGWEAIRKMMNAAHPHENRPRENPGFFVVGEECPQFLRTVLSLARLEKDMDDIDTRAEDHIADTTRYRVRASGVIVGMGHHTGMQ